MTPPATGGSVEPLHDLAHHRNVELEDDAQIGLVGAGFRHPAEGRHLDAYHQRLPCVVFEPLVSERRPFGALDGDAQCGLQDQVVWSFLVV